MIVGIDYDTYKATICILDFDAVAVPRFAQARFRPASRSGEEAAIRSLPGVFGAMNGAAAELGLAAAGEPHVYFVERGYGTSRRADWILGAYFAAIWTSLSRVALPADGLNPLDLREWKRHVTADSGIGLTVKGAGNGNAKKELANAASAELLARILGGARSGLDADHLDAFAIAYTGRKLNAKASAVEA